MTSSSIHGTCVAIAGRGVLLRGRSGAGKSDLALRLIEDGARLVADDRVSLRVMRGKLIAAAPQNLHGLIEVRGVGIVPVKARASAVVALVVDLVAAKEVPRLPEPCSVQIEGIAVPHVRLAPFEASAVTKVRLALRFGAGFTATARRPKRRAQRTSSR